MVKKTPFYLSGVRFLHSTSVCMAKKHRNHVQYIEKNENLWYIHIDIRYNY